MLRIGLAALVSGALALLALTGVSAAPDNKNVQSFQVTCEGMGTFEVAALGAGAVVFSDEHGVLIAKRIEGESAVTITVEGEVVAQFTESFEEAVPGGGFQDRLVECAFTQQFEDSFRINKKEADELGLDESQIGATAIVTVEVSGTAWVIAPGH